LNLMYWIPPKLCGSVKIIGSHDIPRFWFGLLGPGWESDVSKLGWLLFRRLWLFWFEGSSSWFCLLVLCPGSGMYLMSGEAEECSLGILG
jgi:hypothetical protein